ncbi:MAG: tubulin-like doman-containing protein [Gemmataceae bacterium]
MAIHLATHEEPLPGYRLIERLGRGGFGEVWKVEAPGGLLKAMKFVFGDLEAGDEDSRPAEQELKALQRVQTIRHPYVLSLERYDIRDGQLMIVMELADRNLWDRYRECRGQGLPGIPRDELLRYMEETAEALDLMNNHYKIQHLDVKPQNLFLVFNHVKVGDFGLAKLLERDRTAVTGGVTPVYAAPETFEGYVSRFSDQYSLAIVFQELLTGVRPFSGANTRQLLMQHISGTPDLHPLPAADKPIIARALSKKPDERWPTCADMVRAIKLSGLASPPSTPITGKTGHPQGPSDSNDSANLITRLQYGASNRTAANNDPMKTQTPVPAFGGSRPGTVPPVMPQLVTVGPAGSVVPRLVTPSANNNAFASPAITLTRQQIVQTARMNSLGIAPPEKHGDGALMPTLVIGVGHLGKLVLESLRAVVADHFGSPDRVPNVRFLYIDTDPAASGETPLQASAAIGTAHTVLARLNRPAHYLQSTTLPPVEPWLPPGSLYKIARNPGAADGVRSFGRLALIDNHRLVSSRIRAELETFLTDESLEKTATETKLGIRTNRPRTYLIAGLGGGTGGGMFLDLAYLLRHELRGLGYLRPEVVGMFLVPPAEASAARNASLGNTFAAITELFQFQARRTKYQATFDKGEAPIHDADAPFARVSFLQLPKSVDAKSRQLVTARAARAIFNESLTPAGRVIDEMRDVYRNAYPSPLPTCQAFGSFRLTWPRPEVLAAATRRFAQRMLQRWTGKDAAPVREAVAKWLDTRWIERKLDFEQMVSGFEDAAKAQLHEDPDKVFDAFIDPLRTRTPSTAKLDATAVCSVLDQLLKLVGKPDPTQPDGTGTLHAPLAEHYDKIGKDGESQLAVMAVSFIEQPQYRLAGAEECVRQIETRLKRHVETLEPMYADQVKDLKQTYQRLLQMIGNLTTGGSWKHSAELLELLRAYPRKRLRIDILDFALSTYRKLLGTTPEYLRDIGICRSGLNDMHAAVGAGAEAGTGAAGPAKLILPEGCKTLDDAADRFLAGLNPADVLAFDQLLQSELTKKFRGLAAIALKPLEKGPPFRELLLTRSREFLDAKLDAANPAAVFFRNRTGGTEDYPLIADAYHGAAPDTIGYKGKTPDEIATLAAPPGEAGNRFRAVVKAALPKVEFTAAPLEDDIVFYRECPQLEMTDLPQLGEHGRAAAESLAAAEHHPHSRIDIVWEPATA